MALRRAFSPCLEAHEKGTRSAEAARATQGLKSVHRQGGSIPLGGLKIDVSTGGRMPDFTLELLAINPVEFNKSCCLPSRAVPELS